MLLNRDLILFRLQQNQDNEKECVATLGPYATSHRSNYAQLMELNARTVVNSITVEKCVVLASQRASKREKITTS